MKISEDIQAQIDFLKRETTRWVKMLPHEANEACAVMRVDSDEERSGLNADTCRFLNRYLYDDPYIDYKDINLVTLWNDDFRNGGAKSKKEVIDFLIRARDAAIAEGK